jgi:hypothetical protein
LIWLTPSNSELEDYVPAEIIDNNADADPKP